MVQLTVAQLEEIAAIQNNVGGQREQPLADVYDFIVDILSDGDAPAPGVDPAVWAWFRGGARINRGIGFFSEFIRAYTTEQVGIREGRILSAEEIQQASDEVILNVIENLNEERGQIPRVRTY